MASRCLWEQISIFSLNRGGCLWSFTAALPAVLLATSLLTYPTLPTALGSPPHFVTKRLVPDSVKLFATGPASFNLKFLSPQVHLPDPKKKKKKKKYHLLYDAFLDSPSQSELCLMWSWFTPNLTCEPFTLRGKHLRGTGWY